ncbi:MAG: hypothetical protein ATN32_05140 [Candidatus Epulonipiscium fishelsonii]|nr:MAG: hypothetical protein ATN32_05140 [Epulopiscium sp. AS2M-Bin002]
MKKIVKIKFVDFWKGFNEEKNIFINILNTKYEILISDNPDYIIYSCFGNKHLKYNCIRIFYTGENIQPDFNICDYAIGYSYIKFEDRYIRFPLYLLNMYREDYYKALNKDNLNLSDIEFKNKFCNFIYSNSNANPFRDKLFKAINKYKKVDSGGKHLNNINNTNISNKYKFQKHYKFSIACENSTTIGYTTEKIVQAFAAKTIPIYWGDPNISKEFNSKAFINCHDYSSFDQVLDKIKLLDNNDDLYLQMINEPVFTENQLKNQNNIENNIEKFLYNIFNQPVKKAFRRERFCKGKRYTDILKKQILAYKLLKMPLKIITKLFKD